MVSVAPVAISSHFSCIDRGYTAFTIFAPRAYLTPYFPFSTLHFSLLQISTCQRL
jgi:hypothetical protein